MSSKEVDFYQQVVDRFVKHLSDGLPNGYRIFGLHNQMPNCSDLTGMIRTLENLIGCKPFERYFPRIKIDCLIAVADKSNRVRVMMLEVKYGNPLRLIDFSQLIGYLQISQFCALGSLVLVSDSNQETTSADFQKLIDLSEMDLSWTVQGSGGGFQSYSVSILRLDVGGGTQFVDTTHTYGLSSWQEILNHLVNSSHSFYSGE